ncbi:hypothetical protein ACLE20_00055 [Rhizobium sp. YIM 134829]|uniref:hypothetical protein n=1 Tax=Rhizobium sp. YIM 134829 TaxID=3390453 RepID=UPI003979E5CB
MKPILHALAALTLLAGCSSTADAGPEPIPGSITYGGQPKSRLSKAPIGSTFTSQLTDEYGHRAEEVYRVEPDRSLKLLRRNRIDDED